MDMFVSLVQLPIAMTVVIGIFVIALLWIRARSIHSILDRSWRLLGGDVEIHNKELKAFVNERRDVERFRFLYRVKIKSYAEMHTLISAVQAQSLDVERLMRARYWLHFDPNIAVKLPSGRQQLGMWMIVGITYFLCMCSVVLIVTPYAALKTTREPSINFLMNSDLSKVRTITFGDPIDLRQCDRDQVVLGGQLHWDKQEVETICNGRKDTGLKSLVEQELRFQRWSGVIFALAFCYFIFVFLSRLTSITHARQIESQLLRIAPY